eukprot:XP_001705468.1 Hypothetical protein GL50803_90942 [Giardia lamblia ATCC 50803]
MCMAAGYIRRHNAPRLKCENYFEEDVVQTRARQAPVCDDAGFHLNKLIDGHENLRNRDAIGKLISKSAAENANKLQATRDVAVDQ